MEYTSVAVCGLFKVVIKFSEMVHIPFVGPGYLSIGTGSQYRQNKGRICVSEMNFVEESTLYSTK